MGPASTAAIMPGQEGGHQRAGGHIPIADTALPGPIRSSLVHVFNDS